MGSKARKLGASVARVLKQQLLGILPGFLFFFILFNVRTVTDSLILGHSDATPSGELALVLLAMVASRLMMIADRLPTARALSRKPLIVGTLVKTLVYSLFALVYRVAKLGLPFVFRDGPLAGARRFWAELDWRRFWGIQLWLLCVLLVFVGVRELVLATGGARAVGRLFFRQRTA